MPPAAPATAGAAPQRRDAWPEEGRSVNRTVGRAGAGQAPQGATSEIWRAAAVATASLTRPQPRSFPHAEPDEIFLKKILDSNMTPALKGVPGFPRCFKPFIFNTFQRFSHIHTHVVFGDNSPRLKEEWKFRLSTTVEKAVDNFRIALGAGFSAPVKNRWPDSNKLPSWMDCG